MCVRARPKCAMPSRPRWGWGHSSRPFPCIWPCSNFSAVLGRGKTECCRPRGLFGPLLTTGRGGKHFLLTLFWQRWFKNKFKTIYFVSTSPHILGPPLPLLLRGKCLTQGLMYADKPFCTWNTLPFPMHFTFFKICFLWEEVIILLNHFSPFFPFSKSSHILLLALIQFHVLHLIAITRIYVYTYIILKTNTVCSVCIILFVRMFSGLII